MTTPRYTVPPPPNGFHLCYDYEAQAWAAFWDAKRVATGPTAWDCRDAYDRWEARRIAPQIRRLACGRYQLRLRGKAVGVFDTRREARAAAGR